MEIRRLGRPERQRAGRGVDVEHEGAEIDEGRGGSSGVDLITA